MKPRFFFAAVAAGALLVVAPSVAAAYTCISSSCPAWCDPAPYALTRASADLGDATTVAEVRRGMDDWTRVSCSSLHTSYEGRSSATAGAGDGQSVIGWVESGWRHDRNAIGVTGPRWGYRGGCISEADMEMNGVDYTWTTDSGRYSTVNAYSIILHEGGHYFGLGHSSSRSATMYAAYGGGISTLSSDDEAGICALYPGGGGGTSGEDPPPDCTSTGCPTGETCVGGTCVPETDPGGGSSGAVCSPCASSADCGGSSDWCLGYPDGSAYCGSACSSDADCGSGSRCTSVSGVGQCVRYDSSGSPTCAGGGGGSPSGCSNDADCGSGEVCSSGSCVAAPTPDPGAGFGEPCTGNADCESDLCAVPSGETTGFCTEVCGDGDCPSGYECVGAGSVDVCAPESSGSEPPPTAEPTPDAGGGTAAPDGGIAPIDPGTGGDDPGAGGEDPGTSGDGRTAGRLRGSGCSATGSPTGTGWWLALALLLLVQRRRARFNPGG